MDWKSRIRAHVHVEGHALDDEVLEELSQHAAGAYETARANGGSHDEAEAESTRCSPNGAARRRSSSAGQSGRP